MKRQWIDALALFLLLTVAIAGGIALLFHPTLLTSGGTPRQWLEAAFDRRAPMYWLLGAALGLLFTMLIYERRFTLDIGLHRAGSGQFGTARWATSAERAQVYRWTTYAKADKPGFVLEHKSRSAEVDASDQNVMLVCPPGGGKTKSILIPTLLYNGIVNQNTGGHGASILALDCKGEEYAATHEFLEAHGYRTLVLDFRHPLRSNHINLMHPINRQMDIARDASRPEAERLRARARAERHAKILGESVYAMTGMGENGGENSSYFAETAKGLVEGVALVVSEFGHPDERHIVSVFRLIVELNGIEENKKNNLTQKNRLDELMKLLPGDLRARLYAGPATSADVRTSMNVFSSALAQLLQVLDAEVEQMICEQSEGFTAEEMMETPTCLYVIVPDEDTTTHFFAALLIMQIGETLVRCASDTDGRLSRHFFVLWDEFGQSPRCKGAEHWFNAWRSRGIRFLIALQSEKQLEMVYGRTRAGVIREAIQIRMYAHLSSGESAQNLERELGKYTVATASVNSGTGRQDSSNRSLVGRSLLTADEIASLPIGDWIVKVSGLSPIRAKLTPYDRTFPHIRPSGYVGEEHPIKAIPYLTEKSLRERYTPFEAKDPLQGLLDSVPEDRFDLPPQFTPPPAPQKRNGFRRKTSDAPKGEKDDGDEREENLSPAVGHGDSYHPIG